ncbi:MAG: hypothetical protein MRY83_05090 [Flavobacteriales bacterium]|nr:hypothetical protein [Flavobacteriales bacterium]
MKIILCLLGFVLSNIVLAQDESKPLIDNVEVSFELGSGGGDYGLQLKMNHLWFQTNKMSVLSAFSYSSFIGSERIDGQFSQTKGFTADNHLRFYTGPKISFFKKMIFSIEGYFGAYHAFTKGNFKNELFEINRDFKSSQFLFDYGSRLLLGCKVKERLSIQLSMNNSWKQVDSGLGFLAGLFAGEPDGKMSFGIGVNYKLK